MDINDLTSSTNTTPTPTPVVSQSNTPIYSAPDTYPVPPAKSDEIKLMAKINDKNDIKQLARAHGWDDKRIKDYI